MRRILFVLALCVLLPSRTWAIPATSCENKVGQLDVQYAIDNTAAGGTVTIPAGTCHWTTPVTFASKKLTIVGAGINLTNIYDNTATGGLVITGCTDVHFVDISQITFVKEYVRSSIPILAISTASPWDTVGFRIHHCRFWDNSVPGGRGILPTGWGLIDNCTFDIEDTTTSDQMISPFGANGSTDGGYTPWTYALQRGTQNALYIEANTFNYANQNEDAIDAYAGARLVIRRNIFNDVSVGYHGFDSGGYRSPVSVELYDNDFVNDGAQKRAVTNRGGTAVYFDNTYGGTTGWYNFLLNYYRGVYYQGGTGTVTTDGTTTVIGSGTNFTILKAKYQVYIAGEWLTVASTPSSATTLVVTTIPATTGAGLNWAAPVSWGWCTGVQHDIGSATISSDLARQRVPAGEGARFLASNPDTISAAGTRYIDGDGAYGYPCRDQPGRGPGGQILAPVYAWNNGTPVIEVVASDIEAPTASSTWMQANRDYYNYVPSGFDGTVGVGRGTKAAMLALGCTTGVAYWVTDEAEWDSTHVGVDGQLYQCSATNTWTLYYTPYTYPHPLQGVTAPSAPTNVRIR